MADILKLPVPQEVTTSEITVLIDEDLSLRLKCWVGPDDGLLYIAIRKGLEQAIRKALEKSGSHYEQA